MPWPELARVRKNMELIEQELKAMQKMHDQLSKKGASNHKLVLDQIDLSSKLIEKQLVELGKNVSSHKRRYLRAKD